MSFLSSKYVSTQDVSPFTGLPLGLASAPSAPGTAWDTASDCSGLESANVPDAVLTTMLSSFPERTKSKLLSRPFFPFDRLFAYMDLRDLVRVRQLSKSIQRLVLEYIAQIFTYFRLLRNHLTPDEILPFRAIHSATGLLLTGTSVVEFLAREPMLCDDVLEIFVPAHTAETLVTFLLSSGFACAKYSYLHQSSTYQELLKPKIGSRMIRDASMMTAFHEHAVEAIIWFERDESVISVTVCPNSPVYGILKQPSVAHTTVATANSIICLFPNALLKGHFNIALREACPNTTWVRIAYRNYGIRGWPILKTANVMDATSPELWPFSRHYMDDKCLALSLSGDVVTFPRTRSWERIRACEFTLVYRDYKGESVVEVRYQVHLTRRLEAYTAGVSDIVKSDRYLHKDTINDVIESVRKEHVATSALKASLVNWMRDSLRNHHWSSLVTKRPTPGMVTFVMRYVFVLYSLLPPVTASLDLRFRQFQGTLFAVLRINLSLLGRDGRCPVRMDKDFEDQIKRANIVVYYTYSRKMRHAEHHAWPPAGHHKR
ncbi:hypothetical protein K435DRAFT_874043 [Dendrothele bispora CBS 962.96]|uniref:F-box domain-containing protein n=1 Tax=Dendrothele bispora (strain CBS 962.96) TaxID=1314807 RepID=A0A4S8KXM3_DENBC|nr:hypothetical protein K435DRAFT_874043 [Dendrothele bispora CBS 962.96]